MSRVACTLIVALTLGVLAVAVGADAQRGAQIPKIGVLQVGTQAGGAHLFEAFKEGMRELGYVEGQSVAYEHRFGENRTERLHEAAAELVRLKMDVIVTSTDQGIAAVQATDSDDPDRDDQQYRSDRHRFRCEPGAPWRKHYWEQRHVPGTQWEAIGAVEGGRSPSVPRRHSLESGDPGRRAWLPIQNHTRPSAASTARAR